MQINEFIQKEVTTAFQSIDSMLTNITYRIVASENRNPESYTLSSQYNEISFRGLIESYKQYEVEASFGKIALHDRKILVPMQGVYENISTAGKLIIDGNVYSIISVQTDPANSLYTIQARL